MQERNLEQVHAQLLCEMAPEDRRYFLTEQERLALQEHDTREQGFTDV